MSIDDLRSFYELFGLRPGFSKQDLKDAYKRLAKQWHPDRFVGEKINIVIAEEKIKAINVAYEVLKAYHESSNQFSTSTDVKTVKVHRTSPQDYYRNAKRLTVLGQYREAAEELSSAIKIQPKYAGAYQFRGMLFSALGFEHRGGSDLKKAALLGIIRINYDDEIADIVHKNSDFKCFRNLLKTDSNHEENLGNNDTPKTRYSQAKNHNCPPRGHESEAYKQEFTSKKPPKRKKSKAKSTRSNSPEHPPSAKSPINQEDSNQESPDKSSHKSNFKKPNFTAKIYLESDFCRESKFASTLNRNANGKTIATGQEDGIIDLWNYKNKRRFHTLKGHTGKVSHLVFSHDSQILFSSGFDGNIMLWSLSDGSFIRSFAAHTGGVMAFEVCHLRKLLITAGGDGAVRVWDLRESKLLRQILNQEAAVSTLALSPTGEITVCGTEDGSIRFCHTLRGGIVKWIGAYKHAIKSLAFSPDGQSFASGTSNGKVDLWKFPSGDRHRSFQISSKDITALAFFHQGKILCGANQSGSLMIWDTDSGNLLYSVEAHDGRITKLLAISQEILLSAGTDGRIREWRIQIEPVI